MSFISFKEEISNLLAIIVKSRLLHGLWLNTLSYLENCGARKIASCEDPTAVKEEMLKHASEEFRHAFYLKKQLSRLDLEYADYKLPYLLGGISALHYLNALDLATSRYLSNNRYPIKQLAYLYVTYAIELRAAELYPLYQEVLKKNGSKIHVQSILLEEKEHLQEMEAQLLKIENSSIAIDAICKIEANLFEKWMRGCFLQIESKWSHEVE